MVAIRTTPWRIWPSAQTICCQRAVLNSARSSLPLELNRSYTGNAALQQDSVGRYEPLAPILRKEANAAPVCLSNLERRMAFTAQNAGPLSPAAQELEARLQSGEIEPMDTLQQAITENRATTETIRVCLISAKERLNKFPRKIRAAEAMKTHTDLIQRLLVHIWGDHRLWVPIVCLDDRAQEALCYLAILQGVDKYILDWISADVDVGLTAYREGYLSTDTENAYSWRSVLLRNLIIAHMNLDTTKKADSALKTFFNIVELKSQLNEQRKSTPCMKKTDFMLASLRPARYALVSMITNGKFSRTDARLYDRLIAFCYQPIAWRASKGTLNAIQAGITRADLQLHHPLTPKASLAMELLRDITPAETFASLQNFVVPAVRRIMEQAHMLKTEQGQGEDAQWIARRYQEAFGEPVRIHEGYKARFWKPPPRTRSPIDGNGSGGVGA